MKTILVDAVNAFIIKGEGIFEKMHKLLETYPNPKIILTNANDQQMDEYGLHNLPYPIFTLKHNPDKVNPEYYTTMLKHLNLKVEDVIYFEHNEDAVTSAQSVGIKTFHYDKDKKYLITLKDFIDNNV